MGRPITRMFDSYSDAQRAVGELQRLGINDDDVSIVSSNADGAHGEHRDHSEAAEDAGKGAATGGLIGGDPNVDVATGHEVAAAKEESLRCFLNSRAIQVD